MIPIEIKQDVVNKIKAVSVFAKHIRKRGDFVGSSSIYIAPISIWAYHIEVMVDTRRNVFKKALNKFKAENKEIKYACFVRPYDCIPYLQFVIDEDSVTFND